MERQTFRSHLSEAAASWVLAVCAVIVTAGFVYRNFLTPTQRSSAPTAKLQAVEYVAQWETVLRPQSIVAHDSAALHVIEFADFECPACRAFDVEVRRAMEEAPGQIARGFIHFPLEYHRFALPAARAAECAAVNGRFAAMHHELFARQDSLGLLPWSEYARAAGVDDLNAFDQCLEHSASVTPDAVRSGREAGERVGVTGTPTVLVNGWIMSRTPRAADLLRLAAGVRAGRDIRAMLSE